MTSTITSLSPSFIGVGSPQFTLTVNGTGFTVNSTVFWNGQVLVTTFVSNIQLTAVVPASLVSILGTASVTVFTAELCEPTSPPSIFTIGCVGGVPTIVSLSPPSVAHGSGAFVLTVNGTNFQPDAVVEWNGSPRVTTYISTTQLTAQILASDVA